MPAEGQCPPADHVSSPGTVPEHLTGARAWHRSPREQNLAFEVAIAAIAGISSDGHDTTTRPRCHPWACLTAGWAIWLGCRCGTRAVSSCPAPVIGYYCCC